MLDLQVIKIKDQAVIRRISLVSKEPKYVIRLTGGDFRTADKVEVNHTDITDFEVESAQNMLVTLPAAVAAELVTSVVVTSTRFTVTPYSKIELSFNKRGRVRGITKAIQQFVKLLLTTPGSDIFHKAQGAGLGRVVGARMGRKELEAQVGLLTDSINRTSKQMVTSQLRQFMPDDERLKKVTVLKVRFDPNQAEFSVRLVFETMAGREAITDLGL